MVDKDDGGFSADELRAWKRNHDSMIAEVRQQGWSRSIELLRSGQTAPGVAQQIVALMEDRRTFWARFDAEFPDRVRISLDGLRYDLTRLRRGCTPGSPIDVVIVALAQTIRRFFDAVEQFDLTTLRCDARDPDWLAFESALRALRKSIGFQINALADSYSIPFMGNSPSTYHERLTRSHEHGLISAYFS